MIRMLLLVVLIVELGIAGYIFTDKGKMIVEDAPYKEVNKQVVKDKPSEIVFYQSNDLKHGVDATFQPNSLAEIKEKYESLFLELEDSTYSKLTDLAQTAFTEYQQKGSDSNALSMMSDYLDKFKILEEQTDQEFASLYSQLEQELEDNGYSTKEAEEFKKVYEEKKKNSMNELLQIVTQ